MSAVDFVDLWNRAATLGEVLSASGVGVTKVTSRAHELRARGVPMKQLVERRGVGGYFIDVMRLTRVAERALAGLPREEEVTVPCVVTPRSKVATKSTARANRLALIRARAKSR